MPKTCGKCSRSFKGFGPTCGTCRKGTLLMSTCGHCGSIFQGCADSCSDCQAAGLCSVCHKTAYPMERLVIEKKCLHVACFRCHQCETKLDTRNFASHLGKNYCRLHYAEVAVVEFEDKDYKAKAGAHGYVVRFEDGGKGPLSMGKLMSGAPPMSTILEGDGSQAQPTPKGRSRFESVLPPEPEALAPETKFDAARITNGWQPICQAVDDEDTLLGGAASLVQRAQQQLQDLLHHGGVAVIRVSVSGDRENMTDLAAFQTLIPKQSEVTMREDYLAWQAPLERAIQEFQPGAAEAFDDAAEQRILEQKDRVGRVFDRLREEVPEDFGSLWVVMMIEEERNHNQFDTPPKFSIVGFRYVGADSDAIGKGGRFANIHTRGVGNRLPKLMDKVHLEPHDYDYDAETHQAAVALYARAFGFASQWLAKEKKVKIEEQIHELQYFVNDCRKSLQTKSAVGRASVHEAERLVQEWRTGSTVMQTDSIHVLSKFLKVHSGRRASLEASNRRQAWRSEQEKLAHAELKLADLQQGEDAVPSEGSFSLLDGEFDEVLPSFFDDQLLRGRWLCFRMEDPRLIQVKYRVLSVSAPDDGSSAGGTRFEEAFAAWRASFSASTSDGQPLRFMNADSVSEAAFREAKDALNNVQQAKFERAIEALEQVDEAQTLCVYRLQAPLQLKDEACRSTGPPLCDLPTTWTSTRPDAKITVSVKAKRLSAWLGKHMVLRSDFLRDSRPGDFGISYKEVVKKARGAL